MEKNKAWKNVLWSIMQPVAKKTLTLHISQTHPYDNKTVKL